MPDRIKQPGLLILFAIAGGADRRNLFLFMLRNMSLPVL
jgi:hypothetical protein